MANGKSIYDVYFEAGESAGEYEASKAAIGGIWDEIGQGREDLAFEQQRISETLDTLTAATELGAQYFGGKQAQKEFETSDLPAVQKEIARQEYLKSIEGVEGASTWEQLDKSVQSDWISKFKPIKVGAGGKQWDTYNTLEKLWEKPLYRFGGDEVGFAFKKSDVMGISQFSKIGMVPKIEAFKTSLYSEATGAQSPIVPPTAPPKPAQEKTIAPGKGTTTTGFDFTKSAQGFKQRNQVPLYADWASGQSELMKAAKQLGWDENLKKWR
jgi:hypothetical protein